jgi:amino acid adenylation domain-containing protein
MTSFTEGFAKGLGSLSPQKRALLELLRSEEPEHTARDRPITNRCVFNPSPQSAAQCRLWVQEQLHPGSSLYTIPMVIHLTTAVDKGILADTLNEIVRRHEALRTTFSMEDGKPIQVITPRLLIDLTVVDLEHLPLEEQAAAMNWHIGEEARRPFHLTTGPLVRAGLLRLGPHHHRLLLTIHHIVADGWSLGVLFSELTTIYSAFSANQPSPLPELPIQYADYAVWQQEWVKSKEAQEQANYWKGQLTGLPMLNLPTDYPRPSFPSFSGARQYAMLSRELTAGLEALSQHEGITLFMTLLAAFQVLLQRLSGQTDFAVGAPIANRTHAETENLIGFFLNTLVLRADLSDDPKFRDLLARVREMTLAAYARQELPLEHVMEALRPSRDSGRTPLFQVFFNVLNFADERLNRPGLTDGEPIADDFAQFDLTLYAGKDEDQLQLQLVYCTDLFESATITRLLEYFRILLTSINSTPDMRISALPFLTEEARRQLNAKQERILPKQVFEPFPREAVEQSITERLAQQTLLNPDRIAVRSSGKEWTYRELDKRASAVAHAIREKTLTIGESRVALLCDHDAPMIAAILGTLKSGHAYVPLDAAHPRERLAAILDDAQVVALVTDKRNLSLATEIAFGLPLIMSDDTIAGEEGGLPSINPDSIAYILYTSGSTGKPKGVVQNHRNVLHHICAYTNNLHIDATDRLSLLASYCFDAAVMDIYGALLNGATLCLFDIRSEGLATIPNWLNDEGISIYHSTPTVYRQMMWSMDREEQLNGLRLVVLGGEPVHPADLDLYRQHCSSECLFINGLGPTESTVALQYFLDHRPCVGSVARYSVPVGHPVENTDVLLLNESDEVADLYGVGEIVIRSRYLALGYWRRPELTRARFRPDPTDRGRRMYYTGDLGRLLPDGSIEFSGRRDQQLKIRGHRVECGEVETVLRRHASIAEALVVARARSSNDMVLVAYVVFNQNVAGHVEELKTFARTLLPDHMVPASIMPLANLPLTINGKVDHRALPPPDFDVVSNAEPMAPRNPLEEKLASLLANVLNLEKVGVLDNFFELGMHSLMAMQFLARIRAALHVEIPLRTIFETPTVGGLAQVIEQLPEVKISEQAIMRVPRENYRVLEDKN